MKKNLKFTLALCSIFFLTLSTGFSQLTVNNCIDYSQICHNCSCLMVYQPVCGCNGVTYSNACFASISGVTSWTNDACGGGFYSSAENGELPDLSFHSPIEQEVVMQILDLEGNVVATPMNGMVEAGMEYLIAPELPAGDYLCQVTTETEVLNQAFSLE